MTKKEIIYTLRAAKLPTDKYWVSFGTALVFYGIKDTTNDIDCGCEPQLIDWLSGKGYDMHIMPDGSRAVNLNKDLTLYENWCRPRWRQFIHGFPVSDLGVIYKMKKEKGRPKDIHDCELIEDYWSKNNVRS